MGQIRWYKRDPNAALDGMFRLTLEERGAYNTVLDLIYVRDGDLPDDDRFISGWLRCDVRVWKRIKSSLINAGKLYIEDGQIRNRRADKEVVEALSRVVSARDAGRASAYSKRDKSTPKANQTNGLAPTGVGTSAERQCQPNRVTSISESSLRSDSESKARAQAERRRELDKEFHGIFWPAYPHKVAKADAHKAFHKARSEVDLDTIMAGLDRYIATKPPDRSWLNGATFLNRKRYNDEEQRSLAPGTSKQSYAERLASEHKRRFG